MSIRILSVDDEQDMEALIRMNFRRQIRKGIFDFVFAHSAQEALNMLSEVAEIGVVLSDINMPEMDGLTMLEKIKKLDRTDLKVLMVSAYGDMDNLRAAMNRGAFDFVTKPISFEDLELTLNKTIEHVAQQRSMLDEHDHLVAIQQDLSVARELQQSILPKIFPPFPDRSDFDIYAIMDAAKSVGGDFYDFFLVDPTHIGVVIADVSGKGIPAAIFMAICRTLMRANAVNQFSTNECVIRTNTLLSQENVNTMFVTLFYGILDTVSGELIYTNAGHNPPFIITPDGQVTPLSIKGGIALGVFEDFVFQSHTTQLKPNDTLFLYTDGVTEAMNATDDQYTEQRLAIELGKLGMELPKTITERIVRTVKEHAAGVEQSDDITALTLKYFG